MRTGLPRKLMTVGAVTLLSGILFWSCGGSDTAPKADPTTTTRPAEDLEMTAEDFVNIQTMTPVGNHFIANPLGHLEEALEVARSPKGGRYPVGTIIQLVPQEAMVKRGAGWNSATNDWEFFFLDVSPEGTTIATRGADEVVNRFGGNCASCHVLAEPKWDLVCDKDRGCEPLPIGDDVILAVQQADPRPR